MESTSAQVQLHPANKEYECRLQSGPHVENHHATQIKDFPSHAVFFALVAVLLTTLGLFSLMQMAAIRVVGSRIDSAEEMTAVMLDCTEGL